MIKQQYYATYKPVIKDTSKIENELSFEIPNTFNTEDELSFEIPEEYNSSQNQFDFINYITTTMENNKEQSSENKSKTKAKTSNTDLLKLDIEDLLKSEGLTSINGKRIKFGSKELRTSNVGSKTSNHRKKDPHTGNAMARDISIEGGSTQDYIDFRKKLLSNPRICAYMQAKGWGIINEITPDILRRTRGTGPHFHFGPDTWAVRTWNAWINNPDIDITKLV